MSDLAYIEKQMTKPKPLVWLHGEVKTPPLSTEARIEAGYLLRQLQNSERLSLSLISAKNELLLMTAAER